MQNPSLVLAPLGQDVSYPDAYDPKLLFPIDRATNRQTLQIPGPWFGADIWNAYEVSWLNRSEEHTSELQSLMRISYDVFCLKKTRHKTTQQKKNKCQTHNRETTAKDKK